MGYGKLYSRQFVVLRKKMIQIHTFVSIVVHKDAVQHVLWTYLVIECKRQQ